MEALRKDREFKLKLYEEQKPHFQINRNKEAKVQFSNEITKYPQEAKKKKMKTKKTKNNFSFHAADKELSMDLESIEFISPPMSPELKPHQSLPEIKNNNQDNDDFWKFYDEPLPLP